MLIGGDFNVIPEDIDCHKPSSWIHDALFQPEPRARYRALLELGYTDAFRSLHPDETGQFTFWDYFRQAFEHNRGIRIDHFLLSPKVADRLQSCVIDQGTASSGQAVRPYADHGGIELGMDILSRPLLTADHRIHYGTGPHQFGDLWIPANAGGTLVPLVVFFHGGWWKSEYDLGYAGYLCRALKQDGIATWSVEYRRVGETGGGWPANFSGCSRGLRFRRDACEKLSVGSFARDHHGAFGRRPPGVLGGGQTSHRCPQRDLSAAAAGTIARGSRPGGRGRFAVDDRSVGILYLCARQAGGVCVDGRQASRIYRIAIKPATRETFCPSRCRSC